MGTGNYSASSNNLKLVHWPLIGGLLHLVQRGGDWAGWTTVCRYTVVIFNQQPRPTQSCHPWVGRCNEYWQWSRPLVGKKWWVLLPGLLAYWPSWLKVLAVNEPAIWMTWVVSYASLIEHASSNEKMRRWDEKILHRQLILSVALWAGKLNWASIGYDPRHPDGWLI